MKTHLLPLSSLMLTLSLGASANGLGERLIDVGTAEPVPARVPIDCYCLYAVQDMANGKLSAQTEQGVARLPCDDDIIMIMSQSQKASTMALASNQKISGLDPIYIGGAMYNLSLGDFTPKYEPVTLYPPGNCGDPVTINKLVGYNANVRVDGDVGQELIFDISGRSGTKVMTLNASCGSFAQSDTGDKYVISGRKVTNGSCTNMTLDFSTTSAIPASSIDLNVLIAEPF